LFYEEMGESNMISIGWIVLVTVLGLAHV